MKIKKKHLRIIDEVIFHLNDEEKYHVGNVISKNIIHLKQLKHDMVKDYEKKKMSKINPLQKLRMTADEYEKFRQYQPCVSQTNGFDSKFSKSIKNILDEGV